MAVGREVWEAFGAAAPDEGAGSYANEAGLRRRVALSPAEQTDNLARERSPAAQAELSAAIEQAPHPTARAALEETYRKDFGSAPRPAAQPASDVPEDVWAAFGISPNSPNSPKPAPTGRRGNWTTLTPPASSLPESGQADYFLGDLKIGWNSLRKAVEGQKLNEWSELLSAFDRKYTPEQVAADPKLREERALRESNYRESLARSKAIDEENAALQKGGRPSFNALQAANTGEWTMKNLGRLGKTLVENPGAAVSIVTQSGPSSAAMLASAVIARVGGFSGGVASGAGGLASQTVEFGNDYAELREKGQSHEEAYKQALIKSGVVGLLDAVSMKSAGSALDAVLGSGGFFAKVKRVGREVGTQAGLGMAGEAGGSLLSGRTPDPLDVLSEGIGEIAMGPVEAITTFLGRQEEPGAAAAPVSADDLLGRPADTAARRGDASIMDEESRTRVLAPSVNDPALTERRISDIDEMLQDPANPGAAALREERQRLADSLVPRVSGQQTAFTTESGARIEANFALVEASDLAASHRVDMQPNPNYPAELQPRDRTRAASDLQVAKIAGNLAPERLGESGDAGTGAPIIGADGLVESGNARTIAIQRAYQQNGPQVARYREWLTANAARFGIDPDAAASMRAPVLVRVRRTPVNRVEFAQQANQASVAQMSPSELARTDAARMGSLDNLTINDDGEFMLPANDGIIRGFFRNLPITEQAALVDANGRVSQAGYARFRNALLAKAYGDNPVVAKLSESMSPLLRNLTNALIRMAPSIAKAKEAMQQGAIADRDITDDIVRAVDELVRMRQEGRSLAQVLAQSAMFPNLTPETIALMEFLDENVRSPSKIGEFIAAYLGELERYGSESQGDMFGGVEVPGRADLIQTARGKVTPNGEAESQATPVQPAAGGAVVRGGTEAAPEPAPAEAAGTGDKRPAEVPGPAAAGDERADQPGSGGTGAQGAGAGSGDVAPDKTAAAPAAIVDPTDRQRENYARQQEIMRKLPSNVGKARAEGKLSKNQLAMLDELAELEKELPNNSPVWAVLMKEGRERHGQAMDEWRAKNRANAEKEIAAAGFKEGDEVEMFSTSMLGPLGGSMRYSGRVVITKSGKAGVRTKEGKLFSVGGNGWRQISPTAETKPTKPTKPAEKIPETPAVSPNSSAAPAETRAGAYRALELVAERLGVKVFKAAGGWHASGNMVEIPEADVDVAAQGGISASHVFAHELGHVVLKKRGVSFANFPKREVERYISNWGELIDASKAFRPTVHDHENDRIRRHAKKPDEIVADAIAAVLIGDRPVSMLRPMMERLGLTERDLGLEEAAKSPEAQAQADLDAALGDLGDLLGKGGRLNITPEQEQKLVPILTRLFDAGFRLGYHKFKRAAKFVLDTIRAKLGAEVADQITIEHLVGAYIGMSGKYREQGAEPARDVVQVESIAAIEAPDDALAAAPEPAPSPVDEAAHTAATSPQSDAPLPTDGQKDAGNYPKGHVRLSGLDISIENPEGSVRSGVDRDGKRWEIKMRSHYGYIRGTVGKDKDHLDVFIRPGTPTDYEGPVWVIDQNNADGSFDEHKIMIGWADWGPAREAYLANYTKGWESRIRGNAGWTMERFRTWLKTGDTKAPVSVDTGALKAAGLEIVSTTTKNGNPVWEVGGNTRAHSDLLKRLGGRWYGPKKVWSFYKEDPAAAIVAALGEKPAAAAPTAAPEAAPAPAGANIGPVERLQMLLDGRAAFLKPAQKAGYDDIAMAIEAMTKPGSPVDPIVILERASQRLYAAGFVPQADVVDEVREQLLKGRKEPAATPATSPAPAHQQIAEWVKARLHLGQPFSSSDLFSVADREFGGTQAEGKYTPKDAYDALELGVNQFMLGWERADPTAPTAAGAKGDMEALAKLMGRIPSQTKRTQEQDEFQQFSTPPTYAFLANWVANVTAKDVYLEPSGGIGGLAVFGKNAGATVIVNEFSARRAEILRAMGFDRVFTENAEQLHNVLPDDVRPTVVVMNPPFSATAGRIHGQRDFMNGARHIDQALRRLEPGGRLVAIMGKGRYDESSAWGDWISGVKQSYSLRADVVIDGKEYAKYGTTFDVRIMVFDKDGKAGGSDSTVRGEFATPADALDALEGVRNDRPKGAGANLPVQSGATQQARPGNAEGGGGGAGTGRPTPAATPPVGDRQPGSRPPAVGGPAVPVGPTQSGAASGQSGGSVPVPDGGRPVGGNVDGQVRADQQPEGSSASPGEAVPQSATGLNVTANDEAAKADLTESVFESYAPQRLTIPGAKPHPGKLVQSAAMASVPPPAPTYTPNLPKSIIESGALSLAQLEAIVYAGQAHSQVLPSGERMGFFIGDGTGVGKGREIAGIILDNWRQGRKRAVWISEKQGLFRDARRDFSGIGGSADVVFKHSATKYGEKIKGTSGILFTTYATLRQDKQKAAQKKGKQVEISKSRVDQIAEWLGADFDGVIVFDEAHNLGNAVAMKGDRGIKDASDQALAGVELQKRLPQARIVYVSATGATEVSNLSYAGRLGLWGEGTPFATVHEFIGQIQSGGLSGMELVARDMKQLGAYLARSLSFDGVTYSRLEHPLTSLQRDIYNELARSWQIVLLRVNEALELTGAYSQAPGGAKNGRARAAALSAFWGAHQRFFNQIITSMQMPAVIDQLHKDIDAGEAAVLQLVNTNEAIQNRQLASMGEDETLEELDLTPRENLVQYIKNSFPIIQYEVYVDDSGNKKTRPVIDSQGNPVISKEAVAAREALLQTLNEIRVPDGPLEIILNEFGADQVAEVTGRGKRVLRVKDKDGTEKVVVEARAGNAAQTDAEAFLDDRKRILVFSDAGGTGFSFHADLTKKNQRKRKHYLIQPGWRADKAVQGFGRTHRTNQKSEPHYYLVTTDLLAQKRFVSSIARRLDQLGALTKGQRDTANQGLFSAKDNLESSYAEDAVLDFFRKMHAGQVPGFDFAETSRMLGFDSLVDPNTGALLVNKIPHVPQFLNRLLSLETTEQERVFNEFASRMEAKIDQAIANGTLDAGMQTIKAQAVRVKSEEVVHSDKRTGAETKYVELELEHPTRFVDFDAFAKRAVVRWMQNIASGKVWAVMPGGRHTRKDGAVVDRLYLQSTGSARYEEAAAFTPDKFKALDEAAARALWDQENAARPKTFTEPLHMVVGSLLPVWDRMPGFIRVARTHTDDGRRYLGRVIHPNDLKETLKRLGATSPAAKMTPAEVMAAVMNDGRIAELANGWKLRRRRVSGDNRMEIELGRYPSDSILRELRRAGAFVERIQFTERVFIPVNQVDVLERILASRPVVDMLTPGQNQSGVEQPGAVYEVSEPKGKGRGRGKETATEGQRDLFAEPAVSSPAGFQAFSTIEVSPAKVGELAIGFDRLDTPEKAAHAFAALRKSPRERFHAIAVDKNDRPIAAFHLFAGTITQTSIYPRELALLAYDTPGAVGIWLSHNHPSGVARPSDADINLTDELSRSLNSGIGVPVKGHVIIAGRQAVAFTPSHVSRERSDVFNIPPAARKFRIPIVERVVRKSDSPLHTIDNPAAVRRAITQLESSGKIGGSGLLFLNAQNQIIGWHPMDVATMRKLKTGDPTTGAGALFRAISRANPAAAIGYIQRASAMDAQLAFSNLNAALSMVEARMLDGFYRDGGALVSTMEQGTLGGGRGPLLSRKHSKPAASVLWQGDVEGVAATQYAYTSQEGRMLGTAIVHERDGKPVLMYDIEATTKGRGDGEAILREVLERAGGEEVYLVNLQPVAQNWWRRMGAQFIDNGGGNPDATITLEGYQAAVGAGRGAGAQGGPAASRGGGGKTQGPATRRAQAEGLIATLAPAPAGVSLSAARNVIYQAVGQINNVPSGGVLAVEVADELPEHLRDYLLSQNSMDDIEGMYDPRTDAIYLIARNIDSAERAQFVLFHELFGHYGLRGMFGNRLNAELEMIAVRNPNIRAAAAKKRAQFGYGTHLAIEEAMADLAGEGRPFNGLAQFMAAVQRALRAIGLESVADVLERMTDAEAMAVLATARAWVEAGDRPHVYSARTMPALNRDAVAPVWYSALLRAVESLTMRSAPAAQWIGTINGLVKSGVKADEIQWSGVLDWLGTQTGKVTREQVADYLRANGVQVQETVLGDDNEIDTIAKRWAAEQGVDWDTLTEDERQEWREDSALDEMADASLGFQGEGDTTKFGQYQLPGAKMGSYRELLLTLPTGGPSALDQLSNGELVALIERSDRNADTHGLGRDDLLAMVRNMEMDSADIASLTGKNTAQFTSTHYEQPNIVAHVRFNERQAKLTEQQSARIKELGDRHLADMFNGLSDAENDELTQLLRIRQGGGARVLFIEEIQSDWAQKGRKAGFAPAEPEDFSVEVRLVGSWHPQFPETRDKWRVTVDGRDRGYIQAIDENEARYKATSNEQNRRDNSGKAPPAPFVTKTEAWVALALKRMIRYAAENGFDSIAWTTGEQQAARYDLSKQVRAIEWSGDKSGWKGVTITPTSGNDIEFRVKPDGVTTGFGHEDTGNGFGGKRLDEIVGKDIAEKIMAERDGSLSGNGLQVGGSGMKSFYDRIVPNVANDVLRKLGGGKVGPVMKAIAMRGTAPQMGFAITPELRQKAMAGQPLFSRRAPAVPAVQPAAVPAAPAPYGVRVRAKPREGLLNRAVRAPMQALGGARLARSTVDLALRVGGWVGERATPIVTFGSATWEDVKAGVVDKYGLDEAVLDRRAQMYGRQAVQLRGVKNLLDQMATLTRAESAVLYRAATTADPTEVEEMISGLDENSQSVLRTIKQTVRDLGSEAVRLKMMTDETFRRNEWAYLHRSYLRHELEDSAAGKASRARRIQILGDHYKHRGLIDWADPKKIANIAPDFWGRKVVPGRPDYGLKDQQFIRLERRKNRGDGVMVLDGIEETNQRGRLLEVLYWPAGEPIPARFGSWDQAGTWQARFFGERGRGGAIGMWRDFTVDERKQMGEIDDIRYAFAKTMHNAVHNVEVGNYLLWLSDTHAVPNEDDVPAGATLVERDESALSGLRRVFRPDEWVRVPETRTGKHGPYKYGALAGKIVPGPIWNDVRQVVNHRWGLEWWNTLLRAWKISKTALSPAVHTNNVMANVVMADWHDVSPVHVLRALEVLVRSDRPEHRRLIDQFEDHGGTQGMYMLSELQREQMEPILDQLRNDLAGSANGAAVGMGAAVQALLARQYRQAWAALRESKAGAAAKWPVQKLIDLYQAEDTVFRLAAFVKVLEEGGTPAQAGKFARRSFLDYDINAPWIQAMRNSAFPFISFTYRAVPMLIEVIRERPWKLAKLALIMGGINAVGYMLGGGDEDKERKLLPEEKAGKVLGVLGPKLIRMPWNDEHGSPVFLDVRRWMPLGDFFDVGQTHAAIPILPAAVPGGPLALLAELLLNKSQFTGKPITKETDSGGEMAAKVADHLYKAFAPNLPMLPGTYSSTAIFNAGSGRTDAFGREQSVGQALASSVGVKLGSYPADVAVRNLSAQHAGKVREIGENIAALRREYERKGISRDEFEKRMAEQVAKRVQLQRELAGKIGQ